MLLYASHALAAEQKIVVAGISELPVYQITNAASRVNILLLAGGGGWRGNLNSQNFLIRQRRSFVNAGANVFIFPNPVKRKISFADRLSDDHVIRILRLVESVKRENDLPIFLAGISRGTVSVGHFAKNHGDRIQGIIFYSGIYLSEIEKRNRFAMERVVGDRIEVPVLVVHHRNDRCRICRPESAEAFFQNLDAPQKDYMEFSGGGMTGDPHGPLHHHGFEGLEKEVVSRTLAWAESLSSD